MQVFFQKHTIPIALLLIKVEDGLSNFSIVGHSLRNDFGSIILSLDQGLTSQIILSDIFRRVIFDMVCSATLLVNSSSTQSTINKERGF